MDALFRFDDARRRCPDIDAWLASREGEPGALARRWFDELRALGDDVRELMHDGQATACVRDAAFAYVGCYTAHVNVGFFRGAELPDPERLLQGTGKRMRHVKLRPDAPPDTAALRALLRAACADMRRRLEVD
ncbi:MAG: DUF1801 domain-containing protein [Planctomycetes bacterium]|nr:DUF1801 domain-containing protein [Planctomycetota bacterium]